jgi:hypothetical protein
MTIMSDFVPGSVAFGLYENEFDRLTLDQKQSLLKLMSKVSESSFRRGFQHGARIPAGLRTIDPGELRYQWSLLKSPDPHSGVVLPAVERLEMEYPVLLDLGLYNSEVEPDAGDN